MGGLEASTFILFGDRDKDPGGGTIGAEGAACAERGNMAGVFGLNMKKFFCGRKFTSSFPFNRLPAKNIA